MNFKNIFISTIIFILIVVSSAIHAVASEIEVHEDAILTSFGCGDYVRLEEDLENMLTEHPLDPVAALHFDTLFHMADVFGPARIEKAALRIKEAAVNSRDEAAGARLLQLQCGLERLFYRFDSARAKKITDELKPVRTWTLYGPYRRHGAGDLERPFQPEIISAGRDMSAQKKIRIADYDGWLDPGKYLFPDYGVVYAAVSFNAKAPVKIRIYSRSIYKAFINGREAVRNVRGRERNMRIIQVRNARGVTLLMKLMGAPFEKVRTSCRELPLPKNARFRKSWIFRTRGFHRRRWANRGVPRVSGYTLTTLRAVKRLPFTKRLSREKKTTLSRTSSPCL